MSKDYIFRFIFVLFGLFVFESCDDGGTSTSSYESDAEGTKIIQKVTHHIKVHKQILDLADIRIEYYDDKNIKHTEMLTTESWDSPEIEYNVVIGFDRLKYGEFKLFFTAKPNIDDILESGDYSGFLDDETANYGVNGFAMHEDGVFGGSWTEGGKTYNYKNATNEQIKIYLLKKDPIYSIYMSWKKDEDKDNWVWFHQTTFIRVDSN